MNCFTMGYGTDGNLAGHIENIAVLKQQYGLNKTEGIIVIEAYRTLREVPPDQVVRHIQGKFAFIIYDSFSKATFVASVRTDAEGHLVLADDVETVKKGCGKSFAPFPKGRCFFSSSGGLKSYEHPLNELKAMPRVDSSGQVCGATFNPLLHLCIEQVQNAFITGRIISDNIITAFEILHSLKKRCTNRYVSFVLKLDMSKAYDCVEWNFIESIMRKMDFSEEWTKGDRMCVCL
ncbi:DNA repair family protein [Hibiscus syriacus]|uniref:DNA repair family protein n=1 Tax=Hibiscus syriacus TaxID=106335 RepID=A0A6A2X102_HIBSY|nr:DNA repair family protein [Hibiscus syriacus]